MRKSKKVLIIGSFEAQLYKNQFEKFVKTMFDKNNYFIKEKNIKHCLYEVRSIDKKKEIIAQNSDLLSNERAFLVYDVILKKRKLISWKLFSCEIVLDNYQIYKQVFKESDFEKLHIFLQRLFIEKSYVDILECINTKYQCDKSSFNLDWRYGSEEFFDHIKTTDLEFDILYKEEVGINTMIFPSCNLKF